MKKFYLIVGALLSVVAVNKSSAQAFSVTYDFASVTTSSGLTDPTTPPTAVGVTFGSFSATGMSSNPNAAARFSFTTNAPGGINGVDNFASFTGSLDVTRYFTVTLTPQAGYTLNLDSIAFTIQRSGTGIRSYAVRSSLDSFGINLPASISPANAALGVDGANNFQYLLDANANAQNGSLITLSSAYDALSSSITFNFYGWNAEANTGTFSIDNVNFLGSVSTVPEPSSIALALFGGGAVLFILRRRR